MKIKLGNLDAVRPEHTMLFFHSTKCWVIAFQYFCFVVFCFVFEENNGIYLLMLSLELNDIICDVLSPVYSTHKEN